MIEISKGTIKTPEVAFDADAATIHIVGRAYPEDLRAFWDPVVEKIEGIVLAHDAVTFSFDLNYHNSGSTRILLNLILFCESDHAAHCQVTMKWHFDPEDDQTKEKGFDFQEICSQVAFHLNPK